MLKFSSYMALAVALSLVETVRADIISQIGTQHFTDGQTGVGTATFNTAVSGQPIPFDKFYGSDTSANFSEPWTFNYSFPVGGAITGATVTIGILDADTAGAGDQVSSFLLDSTNDLTVAANTQFNAAPGATGEYNVYNVPIPSSAFSSLTDGSATFALGLTNGLGVLGATQFNGAGLDFSVLSIQVPVPEPASVVLMLLALSGLAFAAAVRRCGNCICPRFLSVF
jgi:hypothetical protein